MTKRKKRIPARRSTSKISSLPRDLREQINNLLYDGAAYKDIIKQLAPAGVRLNSCNLSRWLKRGHPQWLKQQARLEHMRKVRDLAVAIVKDHDGKPVEEAALQVAASQIYEFLNE